MQRNSFTLTNEFKSCLEIGEPSITVFGECLLIDSINEACRDSTIVPFLNDIIAKTSLIGRSGKKCGFQHISSKPLVNIVGTVFLSKTGDGKTENKGKAKQSVYHHSC